MSPSSQSIIKYLQLNGWTKIGPGTVGYPAVPVKFWSHPEHKPREGENWTQQKAVDHQRMRDKGVLCDCKVRMNNERNQKGN